ncbi:alpha/beta hydrolase [Gracilibacillus sp. YIM 98692]|uniref:alpha/beta hydrolase n=1 Tax=Gracilibacillus sp. YIM 98692 TaxID=2663532 RepID=UPI0013D34D3E|nr:alpha/beta hydrolase [Gracilibacillus sp. YIM 98692]
MPYIKHQNIHLYYQYIEGYEPTSNTVIFLHTNISDHTLYDDLYSYFYDYHILVFDLRGFGKSDLGNDMLSIDLYVEDLHYMIDSFQLTSVYIVGMGFGGLTALKFSTVYPDYVIRLVILSLPCFPQESYSQLKQQRDQLTVNGTRIPVEDLLQIVTVLTGEYERYYRLQKWMTEMNTFVYRKIMELTLYTDPVVYMRQTKAPTLILAGEHDILFPQELLIYHSIQLPHVHHTVVPNASTFLVLDQPEMTAKLIRNFFTALDKRKRPLLQYKRNISDYVPSYEETMKHKKATRAKENQILEVNIVYSFRVRFNGKEILHGWNKRHAKRIFVYLVFHPTSPREEICASLWPDTPLDNALRNLRVYLTHLRRLLQVEGEKIDHLLVIDKKEITLADCVDCDAIHLMHEVKDAVNESNKLLKQRRVKNLLSKITDPGFLTAVYDDWFLNLRQDIEERLIELTIWLVREMFEQGQAEDAIDILKQYVQVFDHNESLYDMLINFYKITANDAEMKYWMTEKDKQWE